jgi:hypothetical protein
MQENNLHSKTGALTSVGAGIRTLKKLKQVALAQGIEPIRPASGKFSGLIQKQKERARARIVDRRGRKQINTEGKT